MYARMTEFLGDLGPAITHRLQNMQRSRSGEVFVTGVRYREYVENGHQKKERSAFQHRLGILKGLAVVSKESYTPIYIAINNLLAAFDAASKLQDHPKKGEVDALAGQLDDFDRVISQGRLLRDGESQFMGNSMELLCYLVDDRAERYKCARVAMRQSGLDGGKDHAKTWLGNREAELRATLNVDQIEIR